MPGLLTWPAQACTTWDLQKMLHILSVITLQMGSATLSRPFGLYVPPKFKILSGKFKRRFVCGLGTAILFRIVERFIVIGRAILDAPHRKVSTIVFLSSIVEVLPLFTSMGITQAIDLFYQTWIRKCMISTPMAGDLELHFLGTLTQIFSRGYKNCKNLKVNSYSNVKRPK